MEAVVTKVNVCEEWKSREVKLTKLAMDASMWQGDVGHCPGHAAAMANSRAHDARPVAWAGVFLPGAHLQRRARKCSFPVEEGHVLRPQ